ncbi:MAG: amino acid-binding protein [Gammaproteobacteria bacterium]|nr:MAG: amino acid-binding protein [Gammaproteobacteria bacterium]
MKHLVISFICPDRPGLVNSLSNIVKQHQGNWQSSSMHNLSGFFAGIIEIAVKESAAQNLIAEIKAIDGINAQVAIASPIKIDEQETIVLELTANDRAGIVQDISSVIHQQNGNLLKLVSRQNNAPHSGQLMFTAKATVVVNDTNIDDLVQALENLADDLMVDIAR